MQRQAGCLIAAEEKIGGGDLSGLWACEPIPVGLPFSGAPLLDREAAHLFPPPEDDEWYAQLLGTPLIPQPDATYGYAYRQSLGVYVVPKDESPESAAPFIDRQARSVRALTRLSLRTGETARELRKIVGAYPEAATYVCLECPLLTVFPGARAWNQSVLIAGLDRLVEPEDAASGALLPEVSLENVLLEFSPLEWEFRATPGVVSYSPGQCRAAWLVRRENDFWLTLFTTEGATPGFEMAIHRIEYSEREHAFGILDREGRRTPVVDSWAAQPFFVALALLRHLSRTVKPEAIADFVMDDKCYVQVRGPVAKLARPSADDLDLRLHFVRRLDTGGRYEGHLNVSEGPMPTVLCLDASTPFAELQGLERVYGRVRKVDLGGRTFQFHRGDATGHSAEAAAALMRWFPGTLRKEAAV